MTDTLTASVLDIDYWKAQFYCTRADEVHTQLQDVKVILDTIPALVAENTRLKNVVQQMGERMVENAEGVTFLQAVKIARNACGVYFIQASNGLIKIGVSTFFGKRIPALQGNSPIELWPVGFIQSENEPFTIEGRLHSMFWEARVRGEWFYPCSELVAYVQELPAA